LEEHVSQKQEDPRPILLMSMHTKGEIETEHGLPVDIWNYIDYLEQRVRDLRLAIILGSQAIGAIGPEIGEWKCPSSK